MVSTLIDLVKIYIQNTGTGAFTLGTAVEGFRGTEALTNGATYSYSIQQGGNWEYGRGSFLASSGTLTRGVLASSTGGSAIDLTQNAQLALVALAEDIFGLANGDIAAEAGAAAGEAAAAAAIEPINAHLDNLDELVAGKEPAIDPGTTGQFWRGDKTWQVLNKAAVGLPNVDNTADADKSVLSASKLTTARNINGVAFDGTTDITINAVDATPRVASSEKGAANGVASLDSGGKVPTSQLPAAVLGAMSYQGTWNASTNTPTIPAAATANKGYFYKVAVAGSTSIDGINDWQVGDWIVSNGTAWDKIDNTDAVSSVAGLVGVIGTAALKSALSLNNVDNTSDANKPVSTAQQTALNLKVSTSTLALGTGAGMVGYTAPGTGGALQTQDTKNRQIVDPRDYGAVMDGSTNDRTALLNADAAGPVRISKPIYVATSFTFTNTPEFVGSGKIVGPSSAVITLPGDVVAPRRLIFDGVSVAGLIEAWLEWFANDVKTATSTVPTVDATSRIQRGMDSIANGGTLFSGPGNWRIDGATAVTMHQGQSFWGAGYGPNRGTVFHWPNTTRKLFVKTDLGAGTRGGTIGNFRAQAVDGSATAASSVAIDMNQSDIMIRDVVMEGAYTGIFFNVSYVSRVFNVALYESAFSGISLNSSLDVFIDKWNISGDDILVTSATPSGGAFVVGDAVTAGSSTGTITKVYSSTRYRVRWLGIPASSGTITATGKSATIAGLAIPHQGGMINLAGTCESVVIGDGDGVGGEYGFYQNGAGSAGRIAGNSGYNVIQKGAYFDSTYSGSVIAGAYGTVIDGWFATSRRQNAAGLGLYYCKQITGSPRCENNAGHGLLWGSDSSQIFVSPRCVGNGRNSTNPNVADIYVTGPAQYFSVDLTNGFCGFPNMAGVSAAYGLVIDTAGAGNFSVIGQGVALGKVLNVSTSDSQYWFGVPGVPLRVDKSALVNAANDSAAASAGVPPGGIYRSGSAMMVRVS